MIVVIEGNGGYTVAYNGQLLTVTDTHGHHVPARFTTAEVDALRIAAGEVLTPLGTGAVTPAKLAARPRPPIQRYIARKQ